MGTWSPLTSPLNEIYDYINKQNTTCIKYTAIVPRPMITNCKRTISTHVNIISVASWRIVVHALRYSAVSLVVSSLVSTVCLTTIIFSTTTWPMQGLLVQALEALNLPIPLNLAASCIEYFNEGSLLGKCRLFMKGSMRKIPLPHSLFS